MSGHSTDDDLEALDAAVQLDSTSTVQDGFVALLRELRADRRSREVADRRTQHEQGMRARATRSQHVLLDWVAKHAYFDGRNATDYIRRFELGVHVLELDDDELRHAFCTISEPRLEERVKAIADEAVDWADFKDQVRASFASQDNTRVTPLAFLEWIKAPKAASLETILADFESKYEELEEQERAAFANKAKLFVRALPKDLRVPFAEPFYDRTGRLAAAWEDVKKRVRQMAGAVRDAEEALPFERLGGGNALDGGAEPRTSGGDAGVEDLRRQVSALTVQISRMLARPQGAD